MCKYNPNFNFIWEKETCGPSWNTKLRKNFSVVPRTALDKKFYIQHEPMKVDGKNFLDFDRQTRRMSFNKTNNLRSIMVTSGENFFKKKNKRNLSNPVSAMSSPGMEGQDNDNMDMEDSQIDHNDFKVMKGNKIIKDHNESMDSHDNKMEDNEQNKIFNSTGKVHFSETASVKSTSMKKTFYGTKKKSLFNISYIEKPEPHSTRHNNIKSKRGSIILTEKDPEKIEQEKKAKYEKQQKINMIPAPCFDKIVSREKYVKVHEPKTNIYGFSIPNRNLTQSKSMCKLNYGVKTHKNRNKDVVSLKVFPSQPEDPFKHIEKINNYTKCTVPVIDKMFSRSDDNASDPLPCYMKVIIIEKIKLII